MDIEIKKLGKISKAHVLVGSADPPKLGSPGGRPKGGLAKSPQFGQLFAVCRRGKNLKNYPQKVTLPLTATTEK